MNPLLSSILRFSCLSLVALTTLGGCGGADSASDAEGDESEGALEASNSAFRNVVVKFDSDKWRGKITKGGGAEEALAFCSLQSGSDYGMEGVQFLFTCRDGKTELLVDTDKGVGRLRLLEDKKETGLECKETELPNFKSAYECKPRGAAQTKFAKFDARAFDDRLGFNWLPSSPASAQKQSVDKAVERIGAKRLQGVMSTNSKKCEVQVEQTGAVLSVAIYQLREDGQQSKLIALDAPEGSALGFAANETHLALQSQVASGAANFSGVRDRTLVVTKSAEDGLRVQIIASDNGGSSYKYCRKLQAL